MAETKRKPGRPKGTPTSLRGPAMEQMRSKIKTTLILKALNNHIIGEKELSSTQVAAAKILLDRTLPQMSQVDSNVKTSGNITISIDSTDKKS